MAMDNFSYKDSIRAAFASCMPCIGRRAPAEPNDNTHIDARTHRSPSSDLEGLLRDTDTEVETLSLHSNIGAGRRKQRRRPAFSLTIFGYTLFGRQPIYLSDDEDERGWRRRPLGTVSSSTLDSDAAPLDASTIARLSSPDRMEIEQQRREEEARRKAERKARRRERRERERMSTMLSLNGGSLDEGDDFEGFQGSGETYLPQAVEFGPFVSGPEQLLATGNDGEGSEDADDADLGGGLYTRKQHTSAVWSGSGSDSRSRTSASISNGDRNLHYNHHQLTQPVSPSYPQTEMQLPPKPTKTKKHRTSKRVSPLSSSTASQSTAPYTPSQSVSASPAVAAFPIPHERTEHTIEGAIRGFPSAGLSGARGKTRDMGAFLASREAAQP
ncbi:hypothetical protein M405DRAFT_816855 [Rhizopogon salebrosus TDB-379]|jgi:hypothetical protein|nr:hypothetical protein M405DRAFT_816855 [Rhizopogon salebrosus TDB-379]